jgi:hypothetical protein
MIVPTWMTKYYVLNPSPQNSVAKYQWPGLHRIHDLLEIRGRTIVFYRAGM